ncbi:hypothetical protein ACOMCU_15960 [Lysinibacillus sp. UGB7]|uniref:hypothetical protein n=1 Tax=Lysinibacillus sp. UGB7 TaxID=3411039 RepID=UPI003B7E53D0
MPFSQENLVEIPLYENALKVLENPMYQNILKVASGKTKKGLVFFDSNSSSIDEILRICEKLEVPLENIKIIDPTKTWSMKFNPFNVPYETAASDFMKTLIVLSNKQDAFFSGQQNQAAKNYILLAKKRFGTDTNIIHVQQMFSEPRYLADIVEYVRKTIDSNAEDATLNTFDNLNSDESESLIAYFENEVLDYKVVREKEAVQPILYANNHKYTGRQVVENRMERYNTGIKAYLNEVAMDSMLSSLFVCNNKKDAFDAVQFLKDGGVLLLNTATSESNKVSPLFGQFFLTHLQSAVFRNAKDCIKACVLPIPLLFYTDKVV